MRGRRSLHGRRDRPHGIGQDPSDVAGLVLLDPVYPGTIDEFIALAPAGPRKRTSPPIVWTGENEEL